MDKQPSINITPKLDDFLSNHSSPESVISIKTEPEIIYFEEGRDSYNLNFDFVIKGITKRKLILRFIKAAVYDLEGNLLSFKHVNHNAVGVAGIHTIGKFEIDGEEIFDIYNPFYNFSKIIPIDHLRYMFTFEDSETKEEFYYGNILVKPIFYKQKVKLTIPLKGLITILDGHDYYSHHRRFSMSIVRRVTNGRFSSNFSRYSVDFTIVGEDGNLRSMESCEYEKNFDFHFTDIKKFYTHEVDVFAPADGEIVDLVKDLDDLYQAPFDMDTAIKENTIKSIAGNYVIIKHNNSEYSHLFHLLKNSITVKMGQKVKRGEVLGKIGFSGAATTYSHLHYQLMDGKDFLKDNALPCKFSDLVIVQGSKEREYKDVTLDTGDFFYSKWNISSV